MNEKMKRHARDEAELEIHGLTVSVSYGDLLKRSIDRWRASLATLVVVTSPTDEDTATLARRTDCLLHRTDAFYRDGGIFNKGRSIEEARALLPASGWHLFFDADIVPPENWLELVGAEGPTVGMLHGARRVREDGQQISDNEIAGFFQLFHSSDPRGAAPLATDFVHAGCYDTDFTFRWPQQLRRVLPLELVHLGEPGQNWCGVGNAEAMARLRARRQHKPWQTERLGQWF